MLKAEIIKMATQLGLTEPTVLPETNLFNSFFLRAELFNQSFIHIRKDVGRSKKDHAIHEIGHLHLKEYLGSAIKKEEFKKLFGNPDEAYPGAWDLFDLLPSSSDWEKEEKLPEFITLYAQSHPEEDYAETFVVAWKQVKSKKTKSYRNKRLDEKVKTVKRWIKETMKR